ncbi:hypothetical protein K3495_g16385, partial [Podosphaera aphanis]
MPSTTEQTVFKSKFGPIAILTPTTFNDWHTDCTSVLSIMGADNLLDGTEPRPLQNGNARKLWDERAREVMGLINGSCSRVYKRECAQYAKDLDVKGLWDKLMENNPNNNSQYVNSMQLEFR